MPPSIFAMPAILIHVPAAPSLDGHPRIEHMSRMQQDLASLSSKPDHMNGTTADPNTLRALASTGRKPRIAIIGAGFAGLRAADILVNANINPTIFEARDRVGGRLCQAQVGGHLVDMGPNWIHGTQNNSILELVRATGTLTHDWPENQVAFAPGGERLDARLTSECAEVVWALIGDAFKYSNEESASIDPGLSLMDFVVEHVEERVRGHLETEPRGEEFEREVARRKELVVKLAELWGGFIGATTRKQSLKFLWLEECLEGENLFCAGTYADVLDEVVRPAIDFVKWNFSTVVEQIQSSQGQDGGRIVTLRTRDGRVEEFDEVIVTCPLGWLKRNKSAFVPELPPRISQAIDSLGYGNLDKVYISFPRAWWDDPVSTGEIASEASDCAMPNVTATSLPLKQSKSTDATSSQDEHYTGFTTFIAPEYAKDTNPSSWFQDCINLAALPRGTNHPTLLFYISGPTSDHIAEILRKHRGSGPPPNDTKGDSEALKAELYAFFRPYISRLPNYDSSRDECTPTDVLAMGWTNDEFAGYGSYSNFPVGATDCDKDIEAMREGEGLVEKGVWLAGEHTAPFVASGTVTGAYWAGEKVAVRVLAAWGLKRTDIGG